MFDPANLIVGFLVSSLGFVLFVYGKRQTRIPQLAVGLVLMICPWFVSSPLITGLIGVGLVGALWGALRLGY